MNTCEAPFAAGALLLFRDRHGGDLYALFQRRSAQEHEPHSWCIYGGMRDPGETWAQTMVREVLEEAGLDVEGYPRVYIHRYDEPGTDFSYHTFAVILPSMLQPVHSIETEDACWVRLGRTADSLWDEVPRPLHSGMAVLIASAEVRAIVNLLR